MAATHERRSSEEEEIEQEDAEDDGWGTTEMCESDSDSSDKDPTFDVLEATRSRLSRISLKKSKSRVSEEVGSGSEDDPEAVETEVPQLGEKDEKCFEKVEKMIRDGQLNKLKVDQCKVYLRKYGLRLTGTKDVLLGRIKEHLEVIEGGGEKKYPIPSFVLNCKGDACTGDVVIFEQNVYEMFSIASRSATGPPCGTRTVVGRIVKESYGAAKQQHTFTIEVLWSKGEKPLPPLHPLLIKGRNLYKLKTMRQRWDDEEKRRKVLQEKHMRGSLARCSRESRIQEKEMRKMGRDKRLKVNKSSNVARKQLLNQDQMSRIEPDVLKTQKIQHHHRHPPENRSTPNQNIQHQKNLPIDPQKPIATEEFRRKPDAQSHNIFVDQNIQRQNLPIQPAICRERQTHNHSSWGITRPQDYNNNPQVMNPPHVSVPAWPHQKFPVLSPPTMDSFFHRQPLRSLNPPPILGLPLQRQHHPVRQQPCRFYPQGRCHFGDNCKYLHEM